MSTTQALTYVAKKPHRCTWCEQAIIAGETYHRWRSFGDSAFTNKMHFECVEAMHEEIRCSGEYEYLPYDNERGKRSEAEETTYRADDRGNVGLRTKQAGEQPSQPRLKHGE